MANVLGKGEKIFQVIIHIFLILLALCAVLPIWILVAGSITGEQELILSGYSFIPKTLSLDAYKYLFYKGADILRAYGITIFITIFGTAVSLLMTPLLAYPLSRKDFKARNIFAFLVFFTMLFNGGLVPQYIMWTTIFHIKDTYAALVLPNLLMTAFNIFLVRNYFTNSLPDALYEAAQLDGASELGIFARIVFPLATPVVATVGLFSGLAYWNSWTNALYYVQDPKYFGIQNLLMRIMKNIEYLRSGASEMAAEGQTVTLPGNAIRMALAFIGILPIIVIYPMLQKYFIKGVVVGAVKG